MAGNLSYLELMASVEPPDLSNGPRVQFEHSAVSSCAHSFEESPSFFPGESPRGSCVIEMGFQEHMWNLNYQGVYSRFEEGGSSSIPNKERSPSDTMGDDSVDDEVDLSSDVEVDVGVEDYEGDEDDYAEEDDHGAEVEHGFSFMLPLSENSSGDEDDPIAYPSGEPPICDDHNCEPSVGGNIGETTPHYKKRIRHKRGEILPDCRQSLGMGPVEIALRGSSNRKTQYIFEPKVGTSFDSLAEAYEFYNLYSWEKGFGISYGRSAKNSGNYKTMQELQCSNQGFDKRIAHQSVRCGCIAAVRLLRTEDHGWYFSKFIEGHNHYLSESYGEKMQWGSHRRIDESSKNVIKFLRDNNVPLGKVHSIMGSIFGSVKDLPFTKRSLRTLCQQLAREQMDDDVKKTLEIFRNMRQDDPDFAYAVDVDKHNRIKTLIWTNHRSKMQYQCFGDVFTFDTTYCTNIYKMPFGLFVGVNNHFQSVIYAGVLMRKETIKSFTWVFKEFLSLMGGKAPITILTDQAIAMLSAVKKSMPETTHLWCPNSWTTLSMINGACGHSYKAPALRISNLSFAFEDVPGNKLNILGLITLLSGVTKAAS